MRKSFLIPAIVFGVLVLMLPHFSHAAISTTNLGPIVSNGQTSGNNVCNCNSQGSAPDFGCIVGVLENGISVFASFSVIIITIYIAWAGIGYIMNPTSPEAREKGNARITNAVIGLLIVLCAWLLVDTVMKYIYNSNASGSGVQLGPWNSILNDPNAAQCLKVQNPPSTAPDVFNNNNSQGGNVQIGTAGTGACNATTVQSAAASGGVNISTRDANTLACLAKFESSCGAVNQNYRWGKGSSAYGPFQLTLQGNAKYFNNAACEKAVGATGPLNCQAGFSGGNPIPGSQIAATCEAAAANLGCSAAAAAALYDYSGIKNWTSDSNSSGQNSCGS